MGVASSDPGWLHGALITLVGLFDWVGLREKFGKTAIIFCHPFQAEVTQLEASYKRRMRGVGLSYRERQQVRVQCSECWEYMVMELLEVHL